jgi:hypothetical protein
MARKVIAIEHDRRKMRVVRMSDSKVLIEASWSEEAKLEAIADALSANKFPEVANEVRKLMREVRV